MPNNLDPEQERLIRLRERQLSTRDPGIKKKKFNNILTDRERKTKNTLSIGRVWNVIPHIWRGVFYGIVIGLITMAVLPSIWISDKAWLVSIISTAVFIVMGVLIGSALDYRDNLKDLSK
jgi:hypothetical protein